jgi:hypothetical protein
VIDVDDRQRAGAFDECRRLVVGPHPAAVFLNRWGERVPARGRERVLVVLDDIGFEVEVNEVHDGRRRDERVGRVFVLAEDSNSVAHMVGRERGEPRVVLPSLQRFVLTRRDEHVLDVTHEDTPRPLTLPV